MEGTATAGLVFSLCLAGVQNYQFNSQACYRCHPGGGGRG